MYSTNLVWNSIQNEIGDLEIINNMVLCAIKTIYGWHDSSASETETQELLIEGALKYNKNISFEDWENSLITFATASVEVVKGIKEDVNELW